MERIEIGASFNKAEMCDGMLVFTDLPELRSIRWKMGCFCYMQQIVFESEMKTRCDPIDLPKLEEFEGPLEESSYGVWLKQSTHSYAATAADSDSSSQTDKTRTTLHFGFSPPYKH